MNNNIYVPIEDWKERIQGWLITDCVIRNNRFIRILLREDIPQNIASEMSDYDIGTKILQIKLTPKEGQGRTGFALLKDFSNPNLGVSLKPIEQDLLASSNKKGTVYAIGSGKAAIESISPKGLVPATKKVVTIDGWAYSVGLFRQIFKRTEVGHWKPFNDKGLVDSSGSSESLSHGFKDMDGPNENHMYAVGGHGEVFFYNGEQWRQCDFPSNEQLDTVTVAPDGTVYIGAQAGNIWRGQGDTWEKIYSHTSSVPYNDSVWFDNKLWLSSDYEFKTVTGDKVEPAMFGEQRLPFSGHMDARDGLLVIASLHQVYAFDSKQWQCLVSPYE